MTIYKVQKEIDILSAPVLCETLSNLNECLIIQPPLNTLNRLITLKSAKNPLRDVEKTKTSHFLNHNVPKLMILPLQDSAFEI